MARAKDHGKKARHHMEKAAHHHEKAAKHHEMAKEAMNEAKSVKKALEKHEMKDKKIYAKMNKAKKMK